MTQIIASCVGKMSAAFAALIFVTSVTQAAEFVLPNECKSGATGSGENNTSDSFPPIVIAYGLQGEKTVSLNVGNVYPMSSGSKVWVANISYNPFQTNGGFNVEVAYTPVFVTFDHYEPSTYGPNAVTLPRSDIPSSHVAKSVTLTVYEYDKDDDGRVIPGAIVELRPMADSTAVSLPSSLTIEADGNGQITLNCVSFREGDVYATVYTAGHEFAYDSAVYINTNDWNLYVEGASE